MKKWNTPLKVFVIVASIVFVLVLTRNIILVIHGFPIIRSVIRLVVVGVIGGSVLGGIGAGIAALVLSLKKLGD